MASSSRPDYETRRSKASVLSGDQRMAGTIHEAIVRLLGGVFDLDSVQAVIKRTGQFSQRRRLLSESYEGRTSLDLARSSTCEKDLSARLIRLLVENGADDYFQQEMPEAWGLGEEELLDLIVEGAEDRIFDRFFARNGDVKASSYRPFFVKPPEEEQEPEMYSLLMFSVHFSRDYVYSLLLDRCSALDISWRNNYGRRCYHVIAGRIFSGAIAQPRDLALGLLRISHQKYKRELEEMCERRGVGFTTLPARASNEELVRIISDHLGPLKEGDGRWFHGTSAQSVVDILKHGIDADFYCRGSRDFSFGFYVNDHPAYSRQWAERHYYKYKDPEKKFESKVEKPLEDRNVVAMVVFQTPARIQSDLFNCLNLDKDRTVWQQVVGHFAKPPKDIYLKPKLGDELRNKVLRADAVLGPINDSQRCAEAEANPAEDGRQLCLKSAELQRYFCRSIKLVVLLSPEKKLTAKKPAVCFVCGRDHTCCRCPVFRDMLVSARTKLIKAVGACRLCLQTGHEQRSCWGLERGFRCNVCQSQEHNTLLHLDQDESVSEDSSSEIYGEGVAAACSLEAVNEEEPVPGRGEPSEDNWLTEVIGKMKKKGEGTESGGGSRHMSLLIASCSPHSDTTAACSREAMNEEDLLQGREEPIEDDGFTEVSGKKKKKGEGAESGGGSRHILDSSCSPRSDAASSMGRRPSGPGLANSNLKAKRCTNVKRNGWCPSGQLCPYAHSKSELIAARSADPLYKTRPCSNWEDSGRCELGETCSFAHGQAELRVAP